MQWIPTAPQYCFLTDFCLLSSRKKKLTRCAQGKTCQRFSDPSQFLEEVMKFKSYP